MKKPPDEILQRSSLFRFLPEDHHARLLERLRELHFDFGDVIVRQGEEADAYYIITSGRARVVKTTERGDQLALNALRPGDEFGEAALNSGGRRTATVRCSSAVTVLRLERADFLELAGEHPVFLRSLELAARHKTLHGFLYEFSNFGRLPAPALQVLIEKLHLAEFPRGETIIREGDPAGPMYIVQQGRVRIHKTTDGRTENLAFYREGDFFGELSLLSGSAREASAEALSDCRLLVLEPEALRELADRYAEFRKLMEERLSQYRAGRVARVPLDFAAELLPADVSVHDKVELDPDSPLVGREEELEDEEDTGARWRRRRKRVRRFPFVAQIDEMDCGAACLGMVCRHFGRRVSLVRIRELCHTSSDGTSLKAICHAATELGLAARALKVSLRNLPNLPLPAVVHWEGNHWVVLYDVTDSHVRVANPASGRRKIPRKEFEQKWSGYAALFDFTADFETVPEGRSSVAWLVPFFSKYRSSLLQVLLLAGVTSVLQLMFPVFTQTVVDTVIVDSDLKLLKLIILGMAAALVFMALAKLAQQYLMAFVAVRIDAAILDFLTRRMLALPMKYFLSRRTGDIQRRLDGAMEVRGFVVQHGLGGLLAAAQLIGALLLMLAYSARLMGVFLLAVPLYAGLVYLSIKYLKPIIRDLEEYHGRYRSHQIDAIKGIEAVKAGSAEMAFRNDMLRQFLAVTRQAFRGTFFFMFYDNAIETIGLISIALFLWVGATMVIDGALTVGGFVAFNSLALMSYTAILRLLTVWERLLVVSVLFHRLNDVLEQEPEQGRDRAHLKPVPSLEGRIEFRSVSFRYGGPESPYILKGIDLELSPGKVFAVVGRSGCGKTTLIKLMAGLIEPTEGTILYDGVDLKTVNHRQLRRNIGLVLQENHIFGGTILQNIAFGDPQPDFDRVLWATQLASAHEFILRLPLGYETKIGESGLALSGGQKQRISIARALYSDPPVLIFDEATSALDSESERAIQDNMAQVLANRTAVVIAHRLSTIRDADSIIVLENGNVAETGTHDELMARRGLYFYLTSQQSAV